MSELFNMVKRVASKYILTCMLLLICGATPSLANEQDNASLSLTKEEKAWLSEHQLLRVSTSPGWAPISFMDDMGTYRGIAIDYLARIENLLGVRFVYIHSEERHMSMDADIISAISNPDLNTPKGFVALDKPFIISPLTIYARDDSKNIHTLEDLNGKKVAVFQSRIAAKVLNRDHPEIHLVKTDIADEAIAAVVSGKVDAYVGSLAVVSYVIREQGVSAVKIVGQTPYRSELHMAVRSDYPELEHILQKALNAIGEEDKNTISRKWTAITYEHTTDYKLLGIVAASLLLVIGLIGLWTWKLNTEIKRRKSAEAEIENARGMLQLVLDTIPIGVFWQDGRGRFLGCNVSFSKMLGLESPFQLVGKSYVDISESVFSHSHLENNQQAIHKNTPMLGIGEQIVRQDGTVTWVRTNRVPLHDKTGHVIGLLLSLEDISEIRDSQVRNVAITEATLECLITIDEHGVIVDFNPAAEVTFGYTRQEAIGSKMADLIIPPHLRAAHNEGMNHYHATGNGPVLHNRIEITGMRRNGEEFPVELAVVPFKESGQTFFLGSLRDISERKLLESEQQRVTLLLEETVNKLKARQLAMDLHSSVTISDLQGTILYANEKFCEISQYSIEELIGRNHSMLKSGLHDRAFYEHMWSTITSGKVWHGEIANRRKDGEIYWLVATIAPVLGEDGLPVQYISVRTDITSQRKTEYELDMARGRELAIGNQIQRTLLFSEAPPRVGSTAIDLHTEPSMGIDGDFYEFFSHSPNLFDIAIADVMGKGIPAALIGAAVKQQLNRVMTEQLSTYVRVPDPDKVINSLHLNISPQLIALESFVTMAYIRCDLNRKLITMVDAGHTRAILCGMGSINYFQGDNLPLGVVAEEVYQQRKFHYSDGDLLFLYSDGVSEAKSPQGEYFGEDRLSDLISRMHKADIPASILSQSLRQKLRFFEQTDSPSDDRTVVVVQFNKLHGLDKGSVFFDLPWEINSLERLRREIRQAAEIAELSSASTDAFVLAGFEAATNIIRHAEQPLSDATLHCSIEDMRDHVRLTLHYVGETFRPESTFPDFSGGSDGGFGLFIIQNSVDKVIYDSPVDGVCRIVLKKRKHEVSVSKPVTLH